jgi:mono/diheme cytochrome c family protein
VPANDVTFPFNFRLLLSAWKILYLDQQPFRPDSAQSAEWNRGAYLVQGLGHCGACHTPRNVLGAERKREYLGGGEAEGWHAPAINPASRAPVSWTAESLARYLRSGVDGTHAVAVGPMAAVVHNLSGVPETEVRAIATYIASIMGTPDAEREQRAKQALERSRTVIPPPGTVSEERADAVVTGSVIYAGACAICHGSAERPAGSGTGEALHLALATSVALPTPRNLIRIILQGIAPPDGERGPFMPGYAGTLTDAQVSALVSYLRAGFSDRPAWPDVEREVRRTRQILKSER